MEIICGIKGGIQKPSTVMAHWQILGYWMVKEKKNKKVV